MFGKCDREENTCAYKMRSHVLLFSVAQSRNIFKCTQKLPSYLEINVSRSKDCLAYLIIIIMKRLPMQMA